MARTVEGDTLEVRCNLWRTKREREISTAYLTLPTLYGGLSLNQRCHKAVNCDVFVSLSTRNTVLQAKGATHPPLGPIWPFEVSAGGQMRGLWVAAGLREMVG